MQPDAFIPALESSGLIVPVGRWVLHEACRQGAAWTSDGRDLSVSVNLSAKQLDRERILDDVKDALRTSGFDPQRLVLELTETALMIDVEATVKRLRALKLLGVRLAIDDFGTGYSSLSYLSQFPIDILKIDRSFISGVAETPEAATLVHTLVQLGSSLGIVTIAEGIETEEQLRKLLGEHTDSGQGFYFSRPIGATQLARLLNNWTARVLTPMPVR